MFCQDLGCESHLRGDEVSRAGAATERLAMHEYIELTASEFSSWVTRRAGGSGGGTCSAVATPVATVVWAQPMVPLTPPPAGDGGFRHHQNGSSAIGVAQPQGPPRLREEGKQTAQSTESRIGDADRAFADFFRCEPSIPREAQTAKGATMNSPSGVRHQGSAQAIASLLFAVSQPTCGRQDADRLAQGCVKALITKELLITNQAQRAESSPSSASRELLQLRAAINTLQRAIDDELSDRQRCVVCLDRPRQVVLLPCKHRCLCPPCAADCRSDERHCSSATAHSTPLESSAGTFRCPLCQTTVVEILVPFDE